MKNQTSTASLLWNTFEKDRKSLENEFDDFQWKQESGLPLEELKAGCEKLVRDNQDLPRITIKTMLMTYIFENAQIGVNPNDWFADRINHGFIVEQFRDMWEDETNQLLSEITATSAVHEKSVIYVTDMNFNHTSPDWKTVMDLGIPGLLARIRGMRNDHETTSQRNFYDAAERVYCGAIGFIERLAREADALKESSPKMEIVSQSLINLTKGAPATLLEALQLAFIYYTIQNDIERTNIRNMGGLDNLYYRFYKGDLESGRYTEEQLREIIDYFLYRNYARKVKASIPFYLGGRDKDGNDLLNELSYVLVEEYRKLVIPDPKIIIKTHKDIPADFIEMVFSCIREGISSFSFFNDEVAVKALEKLGESSEDARSYTIIGCYEPTAEGKEVACTCAVYFNIAKALEIAIHNGYDPVARHTAGPAGNSDDFSSFEGFYAYWKRLLKIFVDESMMVTNEREKHYMDINPAPFFSSTLTECVERGKDAYAGGAKYNNTSIPVFGLATAVDSLLAIKKVVFEEKLLSLEAFAAVLADNWSGQEALRFQVQNSTPKYGNQHPEADDLMTDIVQYVASLINKKPNGRGGVWRCGLFSIYYHEEYGKMTGATPDGRLAGEPVSKNLCATIAQDKLGPTALINSVCKIDFTDIPNGSTLDLMLHKTAAAGKEGLAAMIGLMNTFIAQGGLALHMNVFDPSVLKEAQKNPEEYATLQVRLCGWNEYFVTLSKTLQDEFIKQSEHSMGV